MLVKRTYDGVVRKVYFPPGLVFYTAFGGDGKVENMQLGVSTRVWYANCLNVAGTTTPTAAYVEVFSNDPADTPPSEYQRR